MNPTPVIDMFSGTGELARAVADGLNEFTCFQSFSDNYGPARKYLASRFHGAEVCKDFREQIVTLGAPCQDLSVAGNAVVRLQARLMLRRGLTAINDTKGTL